MCYPKPGPRCFPHMRAQHMRARVQLTTAETKLADATAAHATTRTPDSLAAVTAAEINVLHAQRREAYLRKQVKGTATGMRRLADAMDHATNRGDRHTARRLLQELRALQAERSHQLAAYKRERGDIGVGVRGQIGDPQRKAEAKTHADAANFHAAHGWAYHEQNVVGNDMLEWEHNLKARAQHALNNNYQMALHPGEVVILEELGTLNDMSAVRYGYVKPGDTGDGVKIVEHRLGRKKPRGVYDDEVTDAVRRFQTDNGIPVTGIVGPDTWNKLTGSPIDEAFMLSDTTKRDWQLLLNEAGSADRAALNRFTPASPIAAADILTPAPWDTPATADDAIDERSIIALEEAFAI